MSTKPDEFREYCLELLSGLRQGEIASKKMFGGVSFSIDGKTFSIIAFDQLWLKVDDETRAQFEAAKCKIFTYDVAGTVKSMNYYTVPEEAMESAALMRPWALLGWDAALRASAAKGKKLPARAKKPVSSATKVAANVAMKPRAKTTQETTKRKPVE